MCLALQVRGRLWGDRSLCESGGLVSHVAHVGLGGPIKTKKPKKKEKKTMPERFYKPASSGSECIYFQGIFRIIFLTVAIPASYGYCRVLYKNRSPDPLS